ncbi:hypothetical protein QTP86_008977 [Hemibagrus guttatus]|nr:hypothetical protein QTP86_008977 [Hemibagrus guttatus]
MTSTAKPQSRMTSTAEPQDQATSTAEQQLRATSTAEHSPRVTSTDERRLRGDDVRLAGVWNSPRGGRAGAGCCRNSPPLATGRTQVRKLRMLLNMGNENMIQCKKMVQKDLRIAQEDRFVDKMRRLYRLCRYGIFTCLPCLFLGMEVTVSQGLEGVQFGDHRISSLLFADDVVLLAPSSQDLQHALGCFAAECEAAGMRVSTPKSEAMVLDQKKVACILQVGGELFPQVEEFKYLGVLFTSEGRMDREIDKRIGAVAAVMWSMYRSVVVKKELSQKAKLSIY